MDKTQETQASVKNGVSRMIFAILSILIEVLVILLLFIYMQQKATWIYSLIRILGLLFVLRIYGNHKTASIRMTWMLVILLLPIFGTFFYLLIGLNGHSLKMRKRYEDIDKILLPMLPKNDDVAEKARKKEETRDLAKPNNGEPIRCDCGKIVAYEEGGKIYSSSWSTTRSKMPAAGMRSGTFWQRG